MTLHIRNCLATQTPQEMIVLFTSCSFPCLRQQSKLKIRTMFCPYMHVCQTPLIPMSTDLCQLTQFGSPFSASAFHMWKTCSPSFWFLLLRFLFQTCSKMLTNQIQVSETAQLKALAPHDSRKVAVTDKFPKQVWMLPSHLCSLELSWNAPELPSTGTRHIGTYQAPPLSPCATVPYLTAICNLAGDSVWPIPLLHELSHTSAKFLFRSVTTCSIC